MISLVEGPIRRLAARFKPIGEDGKVQMSATGAASLVDAPTEPKSFRSVLRLTWSVQAISRLRTFLIVCSLFAVGLFVRLPQLRNPATLNSDVAIVGLQAKHMLEGEFSPFLWGTDYQSSLDALVLAPFFYLFGATPSVAQMGPLLGFFLILLLAYTILRRSLPESLAACCCLLLVFIPPSAGQYTIVAPRIWSVVAVFAAFWLIDRSSSVRRPYVHVALGGFAMAQATFLDMYTLQWAPAVALFMVLAAADIRDGWRSIVRRASMGAVGGLVGILIIAILRGARSGSSVTGMDIARFERNFALLRDVCWSWLFNFKGEIVRQGTDPDIYQAASLGRAVQLIGVVILVGTVATAGIAFFIKRIPWQIRRTAVVAAITAVLSITGFLVSTKPSNLFSARYLTPILWMGPFAAAVPAFLLQRAWQLLAVTWPYLALAMSSWWAPARIDGWLPSATAEGTGKREYALRDWLRAQQVDQAMAGYWDSYRLAFLFDERPQVIPFGIGHDRHRESRREFGPDERATYIYRAVGPTEADWKALKRKHKGGTFTQYRQFGYVVVMWTTG